MTKMLNEENQIHNFISSYGSVYGSEFLTSYGLGSGSGSTTLSLAAAFFHDRRIYFRKIGGQSRLVPKCRNGSPVSYGWIE
jgi:hypothetical protein